MLSDQVGETSMGTLEKKFRFVAVRFPLLENLNFSAPVSIRFFGPATQTNEVRCFASSCKSNRYVLNSTEPKRS